jgi:acetolactate synthase-1/2/3 large subunit
LPRKGWTPCSVIRAGPFFPGIDAFFRFNEKQPDDKKIKFIVPANEQGAGFMASGYARSTGKVGVAFVTSGPGATNTVTPVRDAAADSIPMVVLTGQVPRPAIGTDAFQEAPVFNIMMSCAKHVFLVEKPEELEATLRTAFWIARTGRPGPVVVDIPKDVQLWQGATWGRASCRCADTVGGWKPWPSRACRKSPRGFSLNT